MNRNGGTAGAAGAVGAARRCSAAGGRRRRHRRGATRPVAAVIALAALGLGFGGCATKQDIRDLRAEMVELRDRQDSVLAAVTDQNRTILDSIGSNRELMMGARGALSQQLVQMEQQLIQIQELTGQSQRRLGELRERVEERMAQDAAGPPRGAAGGDTTADTMGMGPASGAGAAGGGDAEDLYRAGQNQLRRGAPGTARRAFLAVVQNHPNHQRAADAQFQIAETYVDEGEYDDALSEFERVIELYPGSERAPHALYRAGVIAQERGNIERAREYFQRVVDGYDDSDVARVARERLDEIGP